MDRKVSKRGGRNTLNTLQIAVGRPDKENLTRKPSKIKTGMPTTKTDKGKKVGGYEKAVVDKNINKIKSKAANLKTDQPLTDTVSDNYWKHLSESQRVALESTLKENFDLHNKVTELEYENLKLKEMLHEAKNLVQVLTEMIEENEGNSESSEHSQLDDTQNQSDESESEPDDVSFLSCV